MRYRVRGVHRPSGKVIDQVVEASSGESVRARAAAKEITVVALDAIGPAPVAEIVQPAPRPLAQAHAPRLEQGHAHGAPVVNVAMPRRGSSLGVASVILGALAFVVCLIPVIGIVGLPLSALGLVLAIIGFVVALTRSGSGIGFTIAGGALCALALFVAGAQLTAVRAMMAPRAPSVGSTSAEPAATTAPTRYAALREAAVVGNAKIAVKSASIGTVPLKSKYMRDREGKSKDALLMIAISITNTSDTRKLDYETVADTDIRRSGVATLADTRGNHYKRIGFGADIPAARIERESLYPGATIEDMLVFEVPIERAETLLLSIPASRFGGSGDVVFELAASEIARP